MIDPIPSEGLPRPVKRLGPACCCDMGVRELGRIITAAAWQIVCIQAERNWEMAAGTPARIAGRSMAKLYGLLF